MQHAKALALGLGVLTTLLAACTGKPAPQPQRPTTPRPRATGLPPNPPATPTTTTALPSGPKTPSRPKTLAEAKAQVAFDKLPLRITGIAYEEGGKAMILMNGRTYQLGEYVDKDLLIDGIDEQNVYFRYKGKRCAKPW